VPLGEKTPTCLGLSFEKRLETYMKKMYKHLRTQFGMLQLGMLGMK
jgi:hypothetical protein